MAGFGTLQAVGERLLVAKRKKVGGERGEEGSRQAGFGTLQAVGERLLVAKRKKVGRERGWWE